MLASEKTKKPEEKEPDEVEIIQPNKKPGRKPQAKPAEDIEEPGL